jgi:hypothetical protein
MPAGWSHLVDELDRWRETQRVAKLWWRDDDAVAPSANLDRLVEIAGTVPIALAVIPADAESELADWLRRRGPSIAILQHGWRHSNHSTGRKKSEFPAERSGNAVRIDLAAGRERLTRLFESRALPVLVPPWNRFDDSHLPLLAACGIRAISRINRSDGLPPALGISEVNVDIDLVDWRGDRGFIGEDAALAALVGHLQTRRFGWVCDEPIGILTHHLIQATATEAFLQQLVAVTCMHPMLCWLDAFEIFTPMPVST